MPDSKNPRDADARVPETVLDVMPMATGRLTVGGQILELRIPPEFDLFTGRPAGSGGYLEDVFPAEIAHRLKDHARKAVEADRAQSLEYTVTVDGRERSHEARLVVLSEAEVLLVVQDVTSRVEAQRELAASREQMRRLAEHAENAREEERIRIARDVHDLLGQALTALRIDVASIRTRLPDEAGDLRDRMNLVDASIRSIIKTVRRIASDLRPGLLDDLGIVAALEWQTEEFSSRTGIASSFLNEAGDIQLDLNQSTALFRVYQEALTNVARHAEASVVQSKLEIDRETLVLTVNDNGRGIRTEEIVGSRSLGLLGMKERLSPWEGRIELEGQSDKGTTVEIILPLTRNQTTGSRLSE